MAKSPKAPSGASTTGAHGMLDPLGAMLKSSFLRRSQRDGEAATETASDPPTSRVRVRKKPVRARKVGGAARAAPLVSPLAPKSFPELGEVPGVCFGTANTGTKYKGRPDLLLALFEPGTTAAGIFTKSTMTSAPVDWCRTNLEKVENSEARALVVNAGNANAFTGKAGVDTVKAIGGALADAIGCRRRDIFSGVHRCYRRGA